jgi:hypothetical protein
MSRDRTQAVDERAYAKELWPIIPDRINGVKTFYFPLGAFASAACSAAYRSHQPLGGWLRLAHRYVKW